MKITIEYESSWRNSFLDGSNNEPLPPKGRKFIGSMKKLNKGDNFIQQDVTLDTVMGIMSRLIGDQRKLYQARNEEYGEYFYRNIEPVISFQDRPVTTNEMTYIRNITGSTDQNSFTGSILIDHPMFTSDYSKEFWRVLFLDFNDLCRFILDGNLKNTDVSLLPSNLAERGEELKKMKPMDNTAIISTIVQLFTKYFPEKKYVEKNGKVRPVRFYAAALYLQFDRLSKKYDMRTAKTTRGTIPGFSVRGFNGRRDLMSAFTTGKPKIIWGNPYIHESYPEGGKVVHLLTKASGQLVITIDINRQRAKELRTMIENAGVSSFYLGKKGLAYVSKIRI